MPRIRSQQVQNPTVAEHVKGVGITGFFPIDTSTAALIGPRREIYSAAMTGHVDTEVVVVSVEAMTAVNSKSLIALADVAVSIHGIEIRILGIQLTSEKDGTAVRLPRYRDASGIWCAAVDVPDEVRGAIADVLLEEGLARGLLLHRHQMA